MTHNWGKVEIASRYTQKTEEILLRMWWDVEGWMARDSNAQGITCIKFKGYYWVIFEREEKGYASNVKYKSILLDQLGCNIKSLWWY